MTTAPYGLLFGRRIRVTVGALRICDLDPMLPEEINEARNLDVTFSVETHARREPLRTELTIYGLSKATRDAMDAANATARATAWQAYQGVDLAEVLAEQGPGAAQLAGEALVSQGATVKIEAGYGQDFGLISRAQILPDGIKHTRANPGWVTTIQAQCGRLPWANAFVSQPVVPGVSIMDMKIVNDKVEQLWDGTLTEAEAVTQGYGNLIKRKAAPGSENGTVMHGLTRDENEWMDNALGLRQVMFPDMTIGYVNVAAYTPDAQALVMQIPSEFARITGMPEPGGLLSVNPLSRNFVEIHALLNHRIYASKQIMLLDELGKPYGTGGGIYRVEHATHTGSNFEPTYYTDAVLRPVSIPPIANV